MPPNTSKVVVAGLAKQGFFVAATTTEVQLDGDHSRIQLFPYGEFRAKDGRPTDAPHWVIADDNGKDICDLANRYDNKLVIDYEHQTLKSTENGQPAPAAGWMEYFYLTPQGVFAEVTWTDKAKQMIQDGEYKYISPVFAYDADGYVRKIINAALTNSPALDGMDEAIAASVDLAALTTEFQKPQPNEENTMELLELLKTLLNLPDADEAELQSALSQINDRATADKLPLTAVYDRVAALSASQNEAPDPEKFVPIDVVKDLQTQLAALTTQINSDKSEQLVAVALSEGRLLPAQKDWALALAAKDPQALTDYLATAEPVAALTTTQTGGKVPDTADKALNAEQLAVCRSLDIAPEEFKKTLAEDATNE